MNKGYIQIYTGNGKGKTTASLGLAIRAAGAGLNVFIVQFMKQGEYSEIKALERFSDLVTIEQYGLGGFVKGNPTPGDIEVGRKGYARAKEILKNGEHHVVILEEGNVAAGCGIISEEELLGLMDLKPAHVELIITGRGALESVMKRADLVTVMREIKHYYKDGVVARVGIEK